MSSSSDSSSSSSILTEAWMIFVFVLIFVLIVVYVCMRMIHIWCRSVYKSILNTPLGYNNNNGGSGDSSSSSSNKTTTVSTTRCDIDSFVGYDKNPVDVMKVVLAHKFRLGNRQPKTEPIPIEFIESPHVKGLLVSRRKKTTTTTGTTAGTTAGTTTNDDDTTTTATIVHSLDDVLKGNVVVGSSSSNKKESESSSSNLPIVIATIRMGFGHHRLAYSTASWAIRSLGRTTIFHDLLNITPSEEADLIKSTDELYSRFSRYASEMGGIFEKIWGNLMLSGDDNALRIAHLTAMHLHPLLNIYPLNIPIITTHQLVALTASSIGFTNVINLVVDNHPQWFLTVPNTLNIVQGPVNYQSFLSMGISTQALCWTGHWCPASMVENITIDCNARIQRRRKQETSTTTNKTTTAAEPQPLRLLIPVGGAGAQRKFIVAFVDALLSTYVKDGSVQLFLNAGDHEHMKTAFLQVLDKHHMEFDTVTTTDGVYEFQEKLLATPNITPSCLKSVTLFAFHEYFPAVATTDILCRVSDILCCKPSELAFYCIPKLHIRRVGDHEADSAKRSSELGDGTLEAREVNDALHYIKLFLEGSESESESSDLFHSMNEAIINNNKIGIYNGCKRAVELVLEADNNNKKE